MSNQDDEFHSQALVAKRSDDNILKWMDWTRWLVWAEGGLGIIVVGVTLWAVSLRSDITKEHDSRLELERKITENSGAIKANAASIQAYDFALKLKEVGDQRTYDSVVQSMKNITEELKRRETLIPEVTEMWHLYENGESNQDAFFIRKGFYSPSDPRSRK